MIDDQITKGVSTSLVVRELVPRGAARAQKQEIVGLHSWDRGLDGGSKVATLMRLGACRRGK
tara:strand:+ start:5605 stop:5790 length:186 start_codon:yes stop_codon:yes gene_type:complete